MLFTKFVVEFLFLMFVSEVVVIFSVFWMLILMSWALFLNYGCLFSFQNIILHFRR
jgi:hypothetical protein